MTNEPAGANQLAVATALGVTDRRVRQMVQEHILPEPHHERGYDVALCRQRYDLFRDNSDRKWDQFFEDAIDGTEETARLYKLAFEEDATIEDVQRASTAAQEDFSRLMFMSACKSGGQEGKKFFFMLWQREENDVLASLLTRGMELLGATHILINEETGETVEVLPPPSKPGRKRHPPATRRRKAG